jgi:hypothetical protein
MFKSIFYDGLNLNANITLTGHLAGHLTGHLSSLVTSPHWSPRRSSHWSPLLTGHLTGHLAGHLTGHLSSLVTSRSPPGHLPVTFRSPPGHIPRFIERSCAVGGRNPRSCAVGGRNPPLLGATPRCWAQPPLTPLLIKYGDHLFHQKIKLFAL